MRYWNRMMELPNSRVHAVLFKSGFQQFSTIPRSWYGRIIAFFHRFWPDLSFTEPISVDIQSFQRIYKHVHIANVFTSHSSRIQRWYKHIKPVYRYERFLSTLQPISLRTLFLRFRCGVHFLEVENQRHQARQSIPEFSRRLCPLYHLAPEDEIHFLFHCKAYDNIRQSHYRIFQCRNAKVLFAIFPTRQLANTLCLMYYHRLSLLGIESS